MHTPSYNVLCIFGRYVANTIFTLEMVTDFFRGKFFAIATCEHVKEYVSQVANTPETALKIYIKCYLCH